MTPSLYCYALHIQSWWIAMVSNPILLDITGRATVTLTTHEYRSFPNVTGLAERWITENHSTANLILPMHINSVFLNHQITGN